MCDLPLKYEILFFMTRHLLLTLAACALLNSCETTGDPNRGGLFGWSQGKANDRLDVREERLNDLEREGAYHRGRTQALEEERERRRQELQDVR